MSISLTPAAAERVRTFMASRGKGVGLRLGVKKTGCSGYRLRRQLRRRSRRRGRRLRGRRRQGHRRRRQPAATSTAPRSTSCAQGLNEAFKFRNPNVKGECGCGESFNV